MIRSFMVILSGGLLAYSRQYGDKHIDQDLISGFLTALASFSTEVKGGAIESLVMEDIRFIYSLGDNDTILVFCCDKDDLEEEVQDRIQKVKNEFYKMFGEQLKNWNGNTTIFRPFDDIIDDLILLPLKLVLVGEAGVGKSTLLNFFPGESILIFDENDNAVMKKIVDVEGIKNVKQIEFYNFDLNTLMEEIRFHSDLLKSADLVLLVVSSGASNVARTKRHVKRLKNFVRKGRLICLANKQDMKDVAYEPEFIAKNYGIKTYGFSAIEPDAKEKFFKLIGQMLSEIFEPEPVEQPEGGNT
ncbi:MAG: GTPase domain-containing protein [Promethearchaeota archaeon]